MSDAPLTVQALLRDADSQVGHAPDCQGGIGLGVSHPHLALYFTLCSCDRAERVLAAQARAWEASLREMGSLSGVGPQSEEGRKYLLAQTFRLALAAGRAALEEETR